MIRYMVAILLACFSMLAPAQTQLRLSDISITEKEVSSGGPDLLVTLKGAQGKEDIVLFADQRYTLAGRFKVKTHKVRRSSLKQSAVYLTMTLFLYTDGLKNERIVQKNFYLDEPREASFS